MNDNDLRKLGWSSMEQTTYHVGCEETKARMIHRIGMFEALGLDAKWAADIIQAIKELP